MTLTSLQRWTRAFLAINLGALSLMFRYSYPTLMYGLVSISLGLLLTAALGVRPIRFARQALSSRSKKLCHTFRQTETAS